MRKVTIQNIAKDLGLSRNTVSMALKGNELVTSRTREMVLRYAEQMGYAGMSPQSGEAQKEAAPPLMYHIMILRKPDVAVYWDKVINGISEEASYNHCQTQVAVVTQEDEEELRLPPGLTEVFLPQVSCERSGKRHCGHHSCLVGAGGGCGGLSQRISKEPGAEEISGGGRGYLALHKGLLS